MAQRAREQRFIHFSQRRHTPAGVIILPLPATELMPARELERA
jgi:hypothetical protein